MKKSYKILIFTSIIIIGILTYFYEKSPFSIKNERVSNLKYKAIPFQDSILVFIPYKIVISNNRLRQIKLASIYDENTTKINFYTKNLIFNKDGIEIASYSGTATEKHQSNYIKIKYRETIFPFTNRTFYYYKGHMIANHSNLKPIDYPEIENQLLNLTSSINFKINQNTVDSLYKIDNQKRFNVNLKDNDKGFMPKYIKAKINSDLQIPVNTVDSVKKMSKEDGVKYLLKSAKTDMRETLKEF